MSSQNLMFSSSPTVVLAGVGFDCPVVIQYNDTPMLEIVREVGVVPGFTTAIPIFHSDGTQLAVVKGAHVFPANEGRGLVSRFAILPV